LPEVARPNKNHVLQENDMKVLDVLNAPWAITPDKLMELHAIYQPHLRGATDLEAVEARLGRKLNNERAPYTVEGTTAVIPIEGVLGKKMNLFTSISGGTSTQMIENDFNAAMDDPAVKSILLSIDSPGGTVDGTENLANVIYAARGKGKPIIALADGLMASAAYWIGSAADETYASDSSAKVGSIGVVATHEDYSQAEQNAGIKVTEIAAGKYKRIASSHAPLSADGRESIQAMVDHIYSNFVDAVARNRRATSAHVADKMADGRIFLGRQAVAAGLIDGVMSPGALVRSMNERGANHQREMTKLGITEAKHQYEYEAIFEKMAHYLAASKQSQHSAAALGNRAVEIRAEHSRRGTPISNIESCRLAFKEIGLAFR
jgi:capsid assembly protease